MAFAKLNVQQAAEVTSGGGSKYISKSGLYDVTLKAVFINQSPGGSVSANLFVNYNGQDQVLYGAIKCFNNDGSENLEFKVLQQLMVLSGITDDVADPEEVELPIGKAGAAKVVPVLMDFPEIDLVIKVKMQYSVWKDSIQERTYVDQIFAANGASADEVIAEAEGETVNIGARLEAAKPYADNVTYYDNLTEEVVNKWIADKRPKNSMSGNTATTTPAKPGFTSKGRFGQK